MRRSWWLIALVCLLAGPGAFADIADNFMAGGIAITGNASLSDDLGDPTSSSNQGSHLTITVSPSATFYLINFFAFALSPSFSYASNYNNGNDYQPVLTYALSLGFAWYPYFDPGHLIERLPGGGLWIDVDSWKLNPNFPLVFDLGGSVGLALIQFLPGKYAPNIYAPNGTPYDGGTQFDILLTPSVGIYYFITERYALDLIVNPSIRIPVGSSGSSTSPNNFPPNNSPELTFDASIGITFFVPWAERSQIRK